VKSKLMRADKLFLSEMVHRNNRKQVRSCWIWWSSYISCEVKDGVKI
jgi:hypothetical protein